MGYAFLDVGGLKLKTMQDYQLSEHRHRFAAWCAASAASASPNCRFSVKAGARLIEESGLKALCLSWETLPKANDFDEAHKCLRKEIISLGNGLVKGTLTDGVAAKLINCYMKPIFHIGLPHNSESLSEDQQQKFNAIHPPIDRLLLGQLAKHDVKGQKAAWRQYETKGWFNFDSDQYEHVIRLVKAATNNEMWKIECYWIGYQG